MRYHAAAIETQEMRYVRLNGYWRMMAPAILTCNGDLAKEDYARNTPALRAIRNAYDECLRDLNAHEAHTGVRALNEVLVSAAVIEASLWRTR